MKKINSPNVALSVPPDGQEPFLYTDECFVCGKTELDWQWVGRQTLFAQCFDCGRVGIRIPNGNRG